MMCECTNSGEYRRRTRILNQIPSGGGWEGDGREAGEKKKELCEEFKSRFWIVPRLPAVMFRTATEIIQGWHTRAYPRHVSYVDGRQRRPPSSQVAIMTMKMIIMTYISLIVSYTLAGCCYCSVVIFV